ncbi:MAG: carboxypeptidase regulatory-like domain-containing protein [Phycisphaerae bacterium]|nr:carboxypeptidase regulatory-like domain-containing protein [Phycisphaerae bacterium]
MNSCLCLIISLLVSGAGDGAAASVPPPQGSLDIPPIIDPARTAVLSGLVPTKSSPDAVVADGLRSVVWVAKPASMKTQPLGDQVMVLGAWGFKPATIVITPKTSVELRGSEPSIRQVKGSGLLTFERRLNRATTSTPVVPERTGVIKLEAAATEDALTTSGAIVVVDTPFSTVAGSDGAFRIVGLAPGRNKVKVRLPDGKEFERTVELKAGGEVVVDWRDALPPPPAKPPASKSDAATPKSATAPPAPKPEAEAPAPPAPPNGS